MASSGHTFKMVRLMMTLLTVTLLVFFLFPGSTPTTTVDAFIQVDIGLGSAIKAIGVDSSCVEKNQEAMVACFKESASVYCLDKAQFAQDRTKIECCIRLLTHDCLTKVAKEKCGQISKIGAYFATTYIKWADGGECQAYGSLEQCTPPPSNSKLMFEAFALFGTLAFMGGTFCAWYLIREWCKK